MVTLAVAAAAMLAVVLLARGCGPPPGLEHQGFPAGYPRPHFDTAVIRVGGREVTVEIADTNARRTYGFMFVSEVPDDRGMIFIYPEPKPLAFWMRNTRVPLDIVFFEESGRILNAHREMTPLRDRPSYPARERCRFALELPGGWLERHRVWIKDRIELPPEILLLQAEGDPEEYEGIPRLIGK